MKKIPDKVCKAWDNRKGPAVFSTVDNTGNPNSIYATCVSRYDGQTILVADNYFFKTKENVCSGSRGSILFITDDDVSYQIKGPVKYHTQGDIFEDMKKWNPKEHPGHAAVSLQAEEIYSGSQKIV